MYNILSCAWGQWIFLGLRRIGPRNVTTILNGNFGSWPLPTSFLGFSFHMVSQSLNKKVHRAWVTLKHYLLQWMCGKINNHLDSKTKSHIVSGQVNSWQGPWTTKKDWKESWISRRRGKRRWWKLNIFVCKVWRTADIK